MNIFELTPRGKLWRGKNTKLFFKSIEDVIVRLRDESSEILIECFPDKSKKLYPDWKRICTTESQSDIIKVLTTVGGNSKEFFSEVAKQFDKESQIFEIDPENQFVSGVSYAGKSLGAVPIPKFHVIFHFSVEEKIDECEKLLDKLKPAHVRFVYLYKSKNFTAGVSSVGQRLYLF